MPGAFKLLELVFNQFKIIFRMKELAENIIQVLKYHKIMTMAYILTADLKYIIIDNKVNLMIYKSKRLLTKSILEKLISW